MVWEEMSFQEFQDGRHPWRPSWISEQNDFSNSEPLCHIKFWLNPTCGLGGDVVWRISRWPLWRPSWISEWNNFSNSESLCHCDASHQVWAQSDLGFGRCRLKNFKMAILDIGMERFQQFWISMLPQCLLLSFSLIQHGSGGDVENVKS